MYWFKEIYEAAVINKKFDKLMDELILEAILNGGFKMPLTPREKETLNKEIANRVYAEGLKFKGVVEELKVFITSVSNKVFRYEDIVRKQSLSIDALENKLVHTKRELFSVRQLAERLNIRTRSKVEDPNIKIVKFGAELDKHNANYGAEKEEKKSYKADKHWEDKVIDFAYNHPRNEIAAAIAREPKNSNLSPSNHGKLWEREEDRELNKDISLFILHHARLHRRNPSSIAFRIVTQLKHIGIDLT